MRVLIVRIGAMGDVLHAMPAVAALRQLHPDWFIGWAIEPTWSALLQTTPHPTHHDPTMPLIDHLYPVPTRAWKQHPLTPQTLRSITTLRSQLRGDRSERYDIAVDMQGSIRSSLIGRLASANRFAGPQNPREAPAALLYQQRIPLTATHVIERGCQLLGAAVGETLRPAPVPFPADPSANRWCDSLLARETAPLVVIAPTAGWGAKQWPAERFGVVAANLTRAGFRVIVNALSPGDKTALHVVEASGVTATLVPSSISQLIPLLRRAALLIAGDTGPLHLAAALHTPVLALFGPTDPTRTGPWATPSLVLRDPSSHTDHSRKTEPESGLMKITIDQVTDAALQLLHAGQDKVKA
jgi:heptosyltransferase-1